VTGSGRAQTYDSGEHSGDGVARAEETFDLDVAYRLHAADVSRWLRRISRQDDVSDLLHEVFVVAQRRSREFRGDASARTWLYAISLRVVAAWRRKQRLRRFFFLEPKDARNVPEPIEPSTPFTAVEAKRATEAVHRVLDALSERDRTLILLFELEGLSAVQIQSILGLSSNGVWVALHRARKRFKDAFVELYGVKE
jgi:RNA polymerase sigma-70 factor (ECF subfamily)